MNTTTRYALLQIPGLLLVILLLTLGLQWGWITTTTATVVFLGWLVKDILLFPLYRPALRADAPPTGSEGMVGALGVCRTAVNGTGMVQIRGENWQCRSDNGRRLAPGERVEVCAGEGMILTVRAINSRQHGGPSECDE